MRLLPRAEQLGSASGLALPGSLKLGEGPSQRRGLANARGSLDHNTPPRLCQSELQVSELRRHDERYSRFAMLEEDRAEWVDARPLAPAPNAEPFPDGGALPGHGDPVKGNTL